MTVIPAVSEKIASIRETQTLDPQIQCSKIEKENPNGSAWSIAKSAFNSGGAFLAVRCFTIASSNGHPYFSNKTKQK